MALPASKSERQPNLRPRLSVLRALVQECRESCVGSNVLVPGATELGRGVGRRAQYS